jgi:hypothetical protein
MNTGGTCLPEALPVNASDYVTCAVLEGVPGASSCDAALGLEEPSAVVAERMSADHALLGSHLCMLAQLPGGTTSCAASSSAGWCYVSGAAVNPCGQSILFTSGGSPAAGVHVWLMC